MISDTNRYRIMVIEDNPGDFAIVEDFLTEQMLAPHIVLATDFKNAASILSETDNSFDIILLDVTLPDKTGKQLITEILQMAGTCPVIILTGYTDIEFSIQSVSLGIMDYLLKDDLNSITLYKNILHAIERKKIILNLVESEKRYSDLFHLSPQPMWVYDTETFKFIKVNKAALKQYLYTEKEFLNMTIMDIRSKSDISKLLETLKVNGKKDVGHFTGRFRHLNKSGEIIEVEVYSAPINFDNRNLRSVIAYDITEKVKYIEAIENQNKQLRQIAWIQSHVVRAPLARMMGIINLFKEIETVPPEQKILIDHFIASGAELDAIIKDITLKTKKIDITE